MRLKPPTEAVFQTQVLHLAKLLGWRWYHTRNSRGSDKGFPDLVLWRERVVYAELKTDVGILRADQLGVIEGLRAAGAEVWVWRPKDWPAIQETLTRARA